MLDVNVTRQVLEWMTLIVKIRHDVFLDDSRSLEHIEDKQITTKKKKKKKK